MASNKIYKHGSLVSIFLLTVVIHISVSQQQPQQVQQQPQQNFQQQQPPVQNFQQQQQPQQNFQQPPQHNFHPQPKQDFRQPPQQFNQQPQQQQNFQQSQENFPLLPPVFIPPNQPVGPGPSLQSPVRNLFRNPDDDDSPLASLFNRITRFFSFN